MKIKTTAIVIITLIAVATQIYGFDQESNEDSFNAESFPSNLVEDLQSDRE